MLRPQQEVRPPVLGLWGALRPSGRPLSRHPRPGGDPDRLAGVLPDHTGLHTRSDGGFMLISTRIHKHMVCPVMVFLKI